jgi:hypothetical protein
MDAHRSLVSMLLAGDDVSRKIYGGVRDEGQTVLALRKRRPKSGEALTMGTTSRRGKGRLDSRWGGQWPIERSKVEVTQAAYTTKVGTNKADALFQMAEQCVRTA